MNFNIPTDDLISKFVQHPQEGTTAVEVQLLKMVAMTPILVQMASSHSSNKKQNGTEFITSDSSIINQENESGVKADSIPFKQYTPPIGPKDEKYRMNNSKRGKAIIFNHEKFLDDKKLEDRTGTHADERILKQRLQKLKFEVQVFNDLTLSKIHEVLKEVSQQNHKDEDCILIAVLSHGKNDAGKDKLYAHDLAYEVEILWSYFTADMCPTLAGKPKIFILQACRGGRVSEQLHFKPREIRRDSSKMDINSSNSHAYSIPVEADILIVFSTYEGRVAYRDTEEGSWYIQELCNELEDSGEKLDLLSLLTNVSRRVALTSQFRCGKQMPVIQSTLTRKLFLSEQSKEQLNITSEFHILLQNTSEKLDQITQMLENKHISSSQEKTRSPKKQASSSTWESLHLPLPPLDITLPGTNTIHKHGEVLKMFLEDDPLKLPADIKDLGELILNFFSCWENMKEEMKIYAYRNLVLFMNENARGWKMYRFFDVPSSSMFIPQHCHRSRTQSDLTDAGNSQSRISKLSRSNTIITSKKRIVK